MKQLFTLLICLFVALSFSYGQQPAQYSMYMLNQFKYNPAYAGLDNSLSVTGVLRKQWVGITGTPSTQHVNAHMPLYFLSGGIGLSFENDVIGVQRFTKASISYTYQIPIGDEGLLSLGGRAGINQRSFDGTKLIAPDGVYGPDPPGVNHQDPFLPVGVESAIAPTVGLGLFYSSESLEIGLSLNNLLEPRFNYASQLPPDIRLVRNYFLTLAYNLKIANSFTIHPSIFVKSDITQTQLDLSALVKYNDNILGGVSFRGYNAKTVDAIVLIAGIKLSEKIGLRYAYDITLSKLNSINTASHEIMLNYNLNKKIGAGIPEKIIYNPRFL